MSAHIVVESFFDPDTNTFTHLLIDQQSMSAVVIDPVLNFDAASGTISTRSADQLIAIIQDRGLKLHWILETHAHADHLSAGDYLRRTLGARIGIGSGIVQVQKHFKSVFNWGDEFVADGSDFDRLFVDGDCLLVGDSAQPNGAFRIHAIATPGHTPDSMSYGIEDMLFVGDTFFAPDTGTARCDFPGGDAEVLWQSLQFILNPPSQSIEHIFLCHDYPPNGRAPRAKFSVAEMRQNIQTIERNEMEFVQFRKNRDANLSAPKLLLPALQVNIRAGKLPARESNGDVYLKLPLHVPSHFVRDLD